MTADEFVSIKSLAARLGMDRSHARRYIIRMGFTPHKRRTQDSGGQLTLCLDARDAEAILAQRNEQGFAAATVVVTPEVGVFYVIQLVPDLAPKRLKLGFAESLDQRLAQHRTAAPTAKVLRAWPCKRAWELTAMDALTKRDCALVMNEVFDCSDIDGLLKAGDGFFSLLPPPGDRLPLASGSPLGKSPEAEGDT